MVYDAHGKAMHGMQTDILVIGAGLACVRLLQELQDAGFRGSITVCSAESALPYNRILLSSLLAGDCTLEALLQHPTEWYAQHNIRLLTNCRIDRINHPLSCAFTAKGDRLLYKQLVIATGSRSALPAVEGVELQGVFGFRDLSDVENLQASAMPGTRAVVIGGGLLGLEAAAGLLAQGVEVTLLHRSAYLMNRQLDPDAAGYVQRALESRGLNILLGVSPARVVGESGKACAVETGDGQSLPADTVVFATGIEPVTALAREAGIEVNRGIVVNAQMRTSVPDVFAFGECCEFMGHTYGLVAPIWEQARVLARVLCGDEAAYAESDHLVSLKVSGMSVHAMGLIDALPGDRELVFEDRDYGIYKRLLMRDHTVVGALLVGDVADSQSLFQCLKSGQPVSGDVACRLLLAGELPVEVAA